MFYLLTIARKLFVIFLLASIYSCVNKNYKYIDSKGNTEAITASTDKEAYALAIRKFSTTKMIHAKTSKSLGLPDDGAAFFDVYGPTGEKLIESVNEDSIKDRANKIVNQITKPIEESVKSSIFSDTAKLKSSPIKIISSRFFKEEYSNYKNISLTFKNISTKRITAARFKWYGENAFGEPAESGGYGGWGGGFTEKTISPGRTLTLQWNILSRDGKKILLAYPTEVVFEDGEKWNIENQ